MDNCTGCSKPGCLCSLGENLESLNPDLFGHISIKETDLEHELISDSARQLEDTEEDDDLLIDDKDADVFLKKMPASGKQSTSHIMGAPIQVDQVLDDDYKIKSTEKNKDPSIKKKDKVIKKIEKLDKISRLAQYSKPGKSSGKETSDMELPTDEELTALLSNKPSKKPFHAEGEEHSAPHEVAEETLGVSIPCHHAEETCHVHPASPKKDVSYYLRVLLEEYQTGDQNYPENHRFGQYCSLEELNARVITMSMRQLDTTKKVSLLLEEGLKHNEEMKSVLSIVVDMSLEMNQLRETLTATIESSMRLRDVTLDMKKETASTLKQFKADVIEILGTPRSNQQRPQGSITTKSTSLPESEIDDISDEDEPTPQGSLKDQSNILSTWSNILTQETDKFNKVLFVKLLFMLVSKKTTWQEICSANSLKCNSVGESLARKIKENPYSSGPILQLYKSLGQNQVMRINQPLLMSGSGSTTSEKTKSSSMGFLDSL